MEFWRGFFENDNGLKRWEAIKAERAKSKAKSSSSTHTPGVSYSESLKRSLGDRNAPLEEKRPRYDRVSEDILKFAVYVEKFDSSDDKIKLLGEDFDEIKSGISNAFILESCEVARMLRSDCEKRLFNSEKGEATFYTKSEYAQNFVLKVINNLSLPGIKARGPPAVICKLTYQWHSANWQYRSMLTSIVNQYSAEKGQ